MEFTPSKGAGSGAGKPSARTVRFSGARRFGLGVVLLCTVKGVTTTTLMVAALYTGIGKMEQPIALLGEAWAQTTALIQESLARANPVAEHGER